MKYTIILLILILNEVVTAQTGKLEINAYDINVNLDLSKKKFLIDVQLSIKNNPSLRTIPLLLNKLAEIKSVRLNTQENIPFQVLGKDTLLISLPEKSAENRKLSLIISYILPVDSFMVKRGMIVMKRFERWYPLQIGDIFSSNLTVNVPNNLTTISNGSCMKKLMKNNRTSFNWKTSNETDLALFVFNPDSMEYKSEVLKGTTINFYFVPGLKDKEKFISLVKSSFNYYSKLMGKYKDNNFTVIEIPADYFLGQGLHTLLLFTPTLLNSIPDPGAWVPHEVGHQWVGNTIHIDETSKGWWFVEESLTEYIRAMYVENEYGIDSLKRILKNVYFTNYTNLVKGGQDVPVLDVVSVNNSIEESQSIYAKGPLILHQVRRCMGDKNWNAMIKGIYEAFKNKKFTLEDLKNCISKYQNGGECLNLLNNLLISKSIPKSISFE
jgi:aminopeptidase N